MVLRSPWVSRSCPAGTPIAVAGPPADAVGAVRDALAALGPAYRPFGEQRVLDAVLAGLPELERVDSFGWMQTATLVHRPGAEWLSTSDEPAIGRLLADVWPDSYARPGVPGVRRWAGVRGPDGRPLAVAADAWSSPEIGFLAGVASAPAARGRGHAAAACALVINELLREHDGVALMVDGWNTSAIRLYRQLGLSYRPLVAARVR